jgi:hypothetical protein
MRWQYRTLQVPDVGTGAFMPAPVRSSTASFNGQNQVRGAPGTAPIPSLRPAALHSTDIGGPLVQPSSVSPNVFYPSLYDAVPNRTMHFPGNLAADHPMPAPALGIGQLVGNFEHRVRVGGRTVTKSLRPFTQWPTYGGGKA